MLVGMRNGLAASPVVSAIFAAASNDWTTVDSTSTMPTGGSISRAGNAMLYDSTGKLTYAPNNIAIGSTVYNTNWTLQGISSITTGVSDPVGGTAASSMVEDGTTGLHRIYSGASSGFTAVAGVSYLVSLDIKPGTRTWTRLFLGGGPINGGLGVYAYFNLSGAGSVGTSTATSPGIVQLANGWYRAYFKVTAGSAGLTALYIEGATADTVNSYAGSNGATALSVYNLVSAAVTYETTPRSGDQVITTASAYYGPRFDYDPVTLAAKGLLVEGTRTNVATAFSTWTQTNCSITGTTTIGPDGAAVTPLTVTTTAGTSFNVIISGSGSASGNTFSIYVKKGSGATDVNSFSFRNQTTATNLVVINFNYDTGAITYTTGSSGASAQNVGNGWWRISISTVAGISAGNDLRIYAGGTGGTLTAGTFAYLYGPQLEAGVFATSLIVPASSGTVTRAAETLSLTGYANRLVEAYYIDEQTGANFSGNSALSTGTVTISPPTFGWVTSLRAYTNAYAGSISTPSWLSFSRAGNAMYYDSTGTLTWAPANLLPNSNNFSAATWATGDYTVTSTGISAPGGRGTASLLTLASAPIVQGVRPAAPSGTAAGITYIWSFVVRVTGHQWWELTTVASGATRSWVDMQNLTTGTVNALGVTITNLGSGWALIAVRFAPNAALTDGLYFTPRASNANSGTITPSGTVTVEITSWQVEPVTYQTAPSAYIPTTSAAVYGPRYDYDPSTVPATPRGLLIEESRANLLTYSEQFDNAAWTKSGILAFGSGSITNATIAPDGTTTADKIVVNTAASSHYVAEAISVTASTNYTFSIYMKAAEYGWALLYIGSIGVGQYINLSTGALGSTYIGAPTATTVTSVGNGWYRAALTFASGANTVGDVRIFATTANNTSSFTGDGTSGVYVWGAQLEAGSFATSYIPTTTASVTRAADVAQLTGSALTTLQGPAASVIAETSNVQNLGRIVGFNGYVSPLNAANANRVAFYVVSGGNLFASNPSGSWLTTQRTASGWSSSGRSIVSGAGTLASDTNVMGSVTAVYLGGDNGNSPYLDGYIRSFAAYNQRLPDAILKQKSTPGAPY